jgi:hypothetical protein
MVGDATNRSKPILLERLRVEGQADWKLPGVAFDSNELPAASYTRICLVAPSGIEPELSALRGRRVNQLHHGAEWLAPTQNTNRPLPLYQAIHGPNIAVP